MAEPAQRRGTSSRKGLVGLVIAGGIGLFGWAVVGFSQLGWHSTNDRVAYGIRFAAIPIVIAAFFWFIVAWQKRHSLSVAEGDLAGAEVFDELAALGPEGLLREVEARVDQFTCVDRENALRLVSHLVDPASQRVKVSEEVQLRTQQSVHEIETRWRDGSQIKIGTDLLYPVMRPLKTELAREVQVPDGRLLGSFDTLALLVAACAHLATLSVGESVTRNYLADAALREILRVITYRPTAGGERPSVPGAMTAIRRANGARGRQWRHWPGQPRAADVELEQLLKVLLVRRPYFAAHDQAIHEHASKSSRVLYRTDLLTPPTSPKYDWWRRTKDRMRRGFGLPSRVVYFSLERARSAGSYDLHLHCDDSLYVDEANVWAPIAKRWLRPLDRRGNYRSYIGWERPAGKAFVGLGAANLANTEKLRDLVFVLRLREKPAGALGWAASVAMATLVAIWLVGATGADSTGQVDLVAFILGLPAVGATALGARSDNGRHGLRSMTALLSTAASLVLSIGAIVLFLSEHQRTHALKPLRAPTHRYFYFLSDYLWIVLFVLASANLLVTMGTLLMRWRRYSKLVQHPALAE